MRIRKTASYKAVGNNLRKVDNYHEAIGRLIMSTQGYAIGAKVLSIGRHYAGLVE